VEDAPSGRRSRIGTILKHIGVVAVALALVTLLIFIPGKHKEPQERIVYVPEAPAADLRSPQIQAANFGSTLVEWGTGQPFLGSGLPGVVVRATDAGSVLNWTLEAWANETAPPPASVCGNPSVHFAPANWVGGADGSRSGSATWSATPEVSQRSLPGGEQCLVRTFAASWNIHVCINDGGPPRFLYRDAAGHLHYDGWDRCLDFSYQAPVHQAAVPM